MALFVRQDENRSELQQRLATELQDRAKKKAQEAELPDGVSDSQYLKNTKQSSSFLGVWLVIGVLVFAVAIFFIVKSNA